MIAYIIVRSVFYGTLIMNMFLILIGVIVWVMLTLFHHFFNFIKKIF